MNENAAARAPYVPIVYGSIATWLGKKNAPGASEHTHRWMVYVRHVDDKDLSYAVSRVDFTLHPSFTNHVRGASCRCPRGSARKEIPRVAARAGRRTRVPPHRSSALLAQS